jgi:hypothetical protein
MTNININTIPDGTTMLVKGLVDFSQVKSRLDGEKLDTDNSRRIKHGLPTESKPHTRISVSQASVVYTDAANPTIAEEFIKERLYLSHKHPHKNYMCTAMNKSQNLPLIYQRDETDPTAITPIFPEGELALGLEVTLLLRVYSTALNKGLSLDAVICDEPARYQTGAEASSLNALVARGYRLARDIPLPAYQSAIPTTC